MTAAGSDQARQRSLRKQDLLLASQLARGQAVGAFDELAGRADALALRVVRVRLWLSDPRVWVAGSAVGSLLFAAVLRRAPARRGLRWGRWAWRAWSVWRAWRSAAPLLAHRGAAI